METLNLNASEAVILSLLPPDGGRIGLTDLMEAFYANRRDRTPSAREFVAGLVRSLVDKTALLTAFRVQRTGRQGRQPLEVWLEPGRAGTIDRDAVEVIAGKPRLPKRRRPHKGRVTWHMIDTAPRDGTKLLIHDRVHGILQAWFAPREVRNGRSLPPAWVVGDNLTEMTVEETPDGFDDGSVTHWTTLVDGPRPLRAVPPGLRTEAPLAAE